MKNFTNSKSRIPVAATLLLAVALPGVAQDNATEAAKKAAEEAFKNPQLQEMLNKVKNDPDAALKNVSEIAKEQMNRVGGVPGSSNTVPATRSEQAPTEPSLPRVSTPTRPAAPASDPATGVTTAPAPRMEIPEPVARGERPAPVSPAIVREPTLKNPPATPISNPGNIPAPRPLKPRYTKEQPVDTAPKRAAGADQMDITADASVMDEQNNILTFTGNVVVQHPGFNLTGDKLVIYMNEDQSISGEPAAAQDDDAPPFKKAIATGGMVVIERKGIDGKSQIAKSRKADYNAVTGDIILSGGPPTLQNGGVFINPSSPQALIVLKGNGQHEVKGEGGRVGFSMPIKGGGKNASKGIPGGSLESISNRR